MPVSADDPSLPEALVKTITHFAPGLFPALVDVPDPRDPTRITYPIEEEILVGILAFMVQVQSQRNIKYKLHTPAFIANLLTILRLAFPKSKAIVPYPDERLLVGGTLTYLLKQLDWQIFHELRLLIIRSLLRSRCLEAFRLFGRYKIAIDGTRVWVFGTTRHCAHCLTQTPKGGETIYYHAVLEAKLVVGGMAFSIATAFMENEGEEVDKQDCERKALDRLAQQLKLDFPQLPIVLLLDGLFACERVFKVCDDNGWDYLITFKEGSMPAVFAEYEALLKQAPGQRSLVWLTVQCRQTYRWANDIDCNGRKIHVLECVEETLDKQGVVQERTRFVHISSFRIDEKKVNALSQGGRDRWKIENQGFNTQKTGGYELEHAYSEHNGAMKCFYLLLQIAHIFNQLLQKGSLLRERIRQDMGSLTVFLQMMWAVFTQVLLDGRRLEAILARRIQIRFDTG